MIEITVIAWALAWASFAFDTSACTASASEAATAASTDERGGTAGESAIRNAPAQRKDADLASADAKCPLRLSAKLEPLLLVGHQTIRLTMRLRNTSDQPVVLRWGTAIEDARLVSTHIATQTTRRMRHLGGNYFTNFTPPIALAPGETCEDCSEFTVANFTLAPDEDRFQYGFYMVVVEYELRAGWYDSWKGWLGETKGEPFVGRVCSLPMLIYVAPPPAGDAK